MENPKIGEVYYMKFTGENCEQRGWRPGIVIQNNIGNNHSPNIIAIPLTTNLKKQEMPTHVVIKSGKGLLKDSMALCENPQRLSKRRIGQKITQLDINILSEIAIAYMIATPMIAFIDQTTLLETWDRSKELIKT